MSATQMTTRGGVRARIEGEGPCLVLLAGLGQTSEVWSAVLPRLVATHTCVLVDHRGVGTAAGRFDVSADGTAADVAEVIEELGGSAAVLGWSMGGAVALTMALARPDLVSSLVLLSTAAHRSDVQRRWTAACLALAESGADRESSELAVLPWLFTSRLLVNHAKAAAIARANARSTPVPTAVLRAQADSLAGFDVVDRLSEVEARTLVVVGVEDLVTPVADSVTLALGIPGAELAVLPQGGHAVVLETPVDVLAPILAFLGSGASASTPHLVRH